MPHLRRNPYLVGADIAPAEAVAIALRSARKVALVVLRSEAIRLSAGGNGVSATYLGDSVDYEIGSNGQMLSE